MRFVLLASALVASCAIDNAIDLQADIPANSKLGRNLLSKARRVNQNQEQQFAWMVDYSIKFESCHAIDVFGGEQEGGEEEGRSPHGVQNLVQFRLCPSDSSCSSCPNSGQYVVDLREFSEVYIQAKQEMQEQICEQIQENCPCYYDDENKCLQKCAEEAGYDFCGQEEDEFNLEEYMECSEAEFGNNNAYYTSYYIGPVCSKNGQSITLSMFSDASCTEKADNSIYEKYNYGSTLPYSSKSLVEKDECISCKEQQENENQYYQNNNQQNNNYYNQEQEDPIELCQQLYEQSAKCEKNLKSKSNWADTGSCTYINKILPALERVYRNQGGGGNAAKVFAWLFAFTTIAGLAACYYYFTMAKRNTVDLSGAQDSSVPGSGIL